MDLKKLFAQIFASIVGIVVITLAIETIITFLITVFVVAAKPDTTQYALWLTYTIYSMIKFEVYICLGIYLGLQSYKKKDVWFTVFKPTKSKAIISTILSILMTIALILLPGQSFSVTMTIVKVLISLIIYFIFFYPFSAICNFIYTCRKDKLFKKSKAAIIFLLVLLNPILLVLAGSLGSIYGQAILYEQCGVKILSFYESSPAREAGMKIDDTIIRINDKEVKNLDDLKKQMDNYNPPADVAVYAGKDLYHIKPVLQGQRFVFGMNVTQAMCERTFKN